MAKISCFEDLEIWQISREVCKDVWTVVNTTPLKKDFKLKEQLNGSSGSVMDNIAEGFERDGNKEFIHFLSIAKASCGEVRSQLYRCMDRNHVDEATFVRIYDKVILNSKKIKSFMVYLKNSDRKGSKFD
ncbi:four helix bundle protein [Constantimarinum furrinae]|uniref:23S rRNA-intervening sequence protein n=1 Tax=Constantimarinum furrinae TaxID=2562285 RepID=A0A7G8PTD2_9FLAO|nr:four helix bundle protein [Constantimarinum furrinae]QNJ97598.1 23S rRNA-intervening sequence protein [Constantimarinum furrinae]